MWILSRRRGQPGQVEQVVPFVRVAAQGEGEGSHYLDDRVGVDVAEETQRPMPVLRWHEILGWGQLDSAK